MINKYYFHQISYQRVNLSLKLHCFLEVNVEDYMKIYLGINLSLLNNLNTPLPLPLSSSTLILACDVRACFSQTITTHFVQDMTRGLIIIKLEDPDKNSSKSLQHILSRFI